MRGDGGLQYVKAAAQADGRPKRFVQYLLVGLLGVAVNEGVLFAVTGLAGLSYVVGGFAGRVVSILVNYSVNDVWTWGERGDPGAREWAVRGVKYVLTRLVGIGIGLAALVVFVELLGINYLVANVLAIGVGVLWGFGASDRWVWRPEESRPLGDSVLPEGLTAPDGSLAPDLLPDGAPLAASLEERVPLPSWGREGLGRADRYVGAVRARLSTVDRPTWYVLGLATLLFVAFSVYTVLLFDRYQLTGADFGSYVHMFSTTLSGHGFLIQGKYRADHPSGVYWGAHFTLTLLFYLPLYALVPRPETLLVAKSFVLAASIPVLWLVARTPLGDRLAGLLVVSYAFNPFLWSAWSFDFQEQSLLPLFVLVAYYLYQRRRYRTFLLALLLVLFTNEFTVPIVAGFLVGLGVRAARRGNLRSEGWALAAGLALALVTYLVGTTVIGLFSTGSGIPIRVLAVPLQHVVTGPRVTVGQTVVASLTHPGVLADALTSGWEQHVLYLLAFGLPVLFLPASDESAVGALVPFVGFAWLFSSKSAYYQFAAHYPFYLLPFVYVGAVHVLARLRPSLPSSPSRGLLARVALTVLLLNAAAFLVIDGGNTQPVNPASDHWATVDRAFEAVPQDASLLTQNDLFPHVAGRPNAHFVVSAFEFRQYQREVRPIDPRFVVYDTRANPHWASVVETVMGDRLRKEYGLYRYGDGIWVFQRGYDGQGRWLTRQGTLPYYQDGTATFEPGDFRTASGERTGSYLYASANESGTTLWYGPYAIFPPGNYTATFRVLVWGGANETAARLDVAAGDHHRAVGSETVAPESHWQNVTVSFTLDRPQAAVEFRGFAETRGVNVLLERVTVAPVRSDDATVAPRTSADVARGDAT